MATSKFLPVYSSFFRAIKSCEPNTYRSIRNPPVLRKAHFHSSASWSQDTIPQRYGAAVDASLPPPPKPAEPLTPKKTTRRKKDEAKADTKSETKPETKADTSHESAQTEKTEDILKTPEPKHSSDNKPGPIAEDFEPLQNKELDIVLSIPSPSEIKGRSKQHPHLEAPPYEHHFDTYSLVRQLAQENAYSKQQAITLMKSIRSMLAENLDLAKEGLVSKSDVENESYLFRAACSELRTTLQTARHTETLKQRTQRAQLQHETDILNQKASQELMTLKEELKGLFNDRKLSLEDEKRRVHAKISELNYEITVLLNSEAKSEVEGLRWVLTRRAASAIGICALMIIAGLNYSSIKSREREERDKKAAKAKKEQEEARYTIPSRTMGTQTESGTLGEVYDGSVG